MKRTAVTADRNRQDKSISWASESILMPDPFTIALKISLRQMSSHSFENDHDLPKAPLARADALFIEMLRQIQEEREAEASFFNSEIEGAGVGFSVVAYEGGEVLGQVTGERAVQNGSGLADEKRVLLKQRGWSLPDEQGSKALVPTHWWHGVTSRTDRRHLAQEMLSVAVTIYGLSEERTIRFQLRHDGMASPSSRA